MEKTTVALGQIWPAQLNLVAHWQNRGRGLPSGADQFLAAGRWRGVGEEC
jgi:hypothetical protein